MTAHTPKRQLTPADFSGCMWAAKPDCPWCGKRNCVAPALSRYGRTMNVCLLCNSQWEAPK